MQRNNRLEEAKALMKLHFGYGEFRTAQESLISALLSGRDVLGIMPTGAGKSMCYQLPALMYPGITLVISPLISLMQDQVRALKAADIAGAYLNSSLTWRQYCKALENARAGMYKIIYVAPERLASEEFIAFAANSNISLVAVDEAHCISQWGHDFRPSYRGIAAFVKKLPHRPIVAAFTATATPDVREDVLKLLELQEPLTAVTGFDRENLYFDVQRPQDKKEALLDFLRRHPQESGIVYCSTRKNVESIAKHLCDHGFQAEPYHAGMKPEDRAAVQNNFLYDRTEIIVATNAFGMGIDKQSVRFVVHYNMPKNMEAYYQEAGRAGRDGARAECLLLYGPADVHMAEFLIEKSSEDSDASPEIKARQKQLDMEKLEKMKAYCTTGGCLRHNILEYFGEQSSAQCDSCGTCRRKLNIMESLKAGRAISVGRRERSLYDMLRSVRTDYATKSNLPPELVFSDRTLEAMASLKPKTEYDMLQIPGVSPAKYQKYGKVFLRVIQRNAHRDSGV